MIFVSKDGISEDSFVELLEKTRQELLGNDSIISGGATLGGSGFEKAVYEAAVIASEGTEFEDTVQQTGTYAFPDIIAKRYFGIEVKHTIGDKWSSTGNSILETTRVQDVERIYLFFGKFGGEIDIKYKPYQDCLVSVAVTHYPRYIIDMNLSEGDSIFDKMSLSYDDFRKEPIVPLRDFYKGKLKEGETLWWLEPEGEAVSSPIIRSMSGMSIDEKARFRLEALALFPEIFGTSSEKFERAAAYLFTDYNTVSSSLRDTFTAGGTCQVKISESSEVTISRVLCHLYDNAHDFVDVLENLSSSKINSYWPLEEIVGKKKLDVWKKLADGHAARSNVEILPSEILENGLTKQR